MMFPLNLLQKQIQLRQLLTSRQYEEMNVDRETHIWCWINLMILILD